MSATAGHPFYNQALHGPYETVALGDWALEDGGTLPDCQLAYATFGRLSPARDNAILVTTWFSPARPRSWNRPISGRNGHWIRTNTSLLWSIRLAMACPHPPHNAATAAGAALFPHVRIADDVRAQHHLLTRHLGIERLALVTGASMGAEQTYEWAVRYPSMVERAAPIAGTARTTTTLQVVCAQLDGRDHVRPGMGRRKLRQRRRAGRGCGAMRGCGP